MQHRLVRLHLTLSASLDLSNLAEDNLRQDLCRSDHQAPPFSSPIRPSIRPEPASLFAWLSAVTEILIC